MPIDKIEIRYHGHKTVAAGKSRRKPKIADIQSILSNDFWIPGNIVIFFTWKLVWRWECEVVSIF